MPLVRPLSQILEVIVARKSRSLPTPDLNNFAA